VVVTKVVVVVVVVATVVAVVKDVAVEVTSLSLTMIAKEATTTVGDK